MEQLLERIVGRVRGHDPETASTRRWHRRAATALILHPHPSGPEIGFIQRASRRGDRWSGQVALPGGFIDDGDAGPRQTCVRRPRRSGSRTFHWYRGMGPFPAIDYEGYTIWGLTHRVVTRFLRLVL